MINGTQEERDQFHSKISHQIKKLFQIEDMSGVEVFTSIARIVQMAEMLDSHFDDDGQAITGSRFRLMLHLFLSEQVGKSDGITPTELSQFQQVSKNTVSALLRGLEEQGYIVRKMDPKDLRIFRIQLSDAGRQLMLEMTPRRIEGMNKMLTGLTEAEVHQLIHLLTKLRHGLERQCCHAQKK